MGEWISVEDRLPDTSDHRPSDESMSYKRRRVVEVIIATKNGRVATSTYSVFGWANYFDVTHWMPLPEPPK